METTDARAHKSIFAREKSGGNGRKSLEKHQNSSSGPRGRWFKSSHSDQKLVEMLKENEHFGFFHAVLGEHFGDPAGVGAWYR